MSWPGEPPHAAQSVGPYTLVIPVWGAGLFSNVNRVVSHLRHSLGRNGCVAVRVDWTLPEQLPELGFGTPADGELWSRFFEPLEFSGSPAHEVVAGWAFPDWSMTGLHAYRMYKRGGWRAGYARAFSEHVRVRPELVARAAALRARAGERYCVGVHYRHPAHAHEQPRAYASLEYFVKRAALLRARRDDAWVVLATDVAEAVERFRAAFGEDLLVQPGVERARADGEQHHHVDAGVSIGQQAVVDALLLASCDVMLHAVSNLATAVGYINPRVRMVFCEPRLVGGASSLRARLIPELRPPEPKGLVRRWRPNG